MRRNNPSYELEGTMLDESHYEVTVTPRHGNPVTFHAQPASTERTHNGWRYTALAPGYFVVKSSPSSASYFTKHKSFEDAMIGANRKARAYGRACSRPIPRSAQREPVAA